MKQNYEDIRSKIADPPLWYDEAGCPRYYDFSPELVNNIYAEEAALLEIACQNCGKRFIVAVSTDSFDRVFYKQSLLRKEEISYGDPPNIGCCPTGPTMGSETREVLELWHRGGKGFDWERVK